MQQVDRPKLDNLALGRLRPNPKIDCCQYLFVFPLWVIRFKRFSQISVNIAYKYYLKTVFL